MADFNAVGLVRRGYSDPVEILGGLFSVTSSEVDRTGLRYYGDYAGR